MTPSGYLWRLLIDEFIVVRQTAGGRLRDHAKEVGVKGGEVVCVSTMEV